MSVVSHRHVSLQSRRNRIALATAALVTGAGSLTLAGSPPAAAIDRPPIAPLSAALEQIRQAEAVALYGDGAIRPIEDRSTAIIALGDSFISGEGVGTYEPGTDGPTNFCHRSPDAAIHRTGIAVDISYNVSCSGASSANIRIGGQQQYPGELVQTDNLAVKARNTHITLIVLVAGANDDIRFGPTATDCVLHWFLFEGPCYPTYEPVWAQRVSGMIPKVVGDINDVRTTMQQAGYADSDYTLVLGTYSSPVSPDQYDNPLYPGKLAGGCTFYDSDLTWARNRALPPFADGVRAAALTTGTRYLDLSRLFHGHEVCTNNTWVRGLFFANPNIFDPNSARQSFHPNFRGHGAFATCIAGMYQTGWSEGSCVDVGSTGSATLYQGRLDFQRVRSTSTNLCLDAAGNSSRNRTRLVAYSCHGGRNQGWWLDSNQRSIHVQLSHDRCIDVPGSDFRAGKRLQLYDCNRTGAQKWVRDGAAIRSATRPDLCIAVEPSLFGERRISLAGCNGSAAQQFAWESI